MTDTKHAGSRRPETSGGAVPRLRPGQTRSDRAERKSAWAISYHKIVGRDAVIIVDAATGVVLNVIVSPAIAAAILITELNRLLSRQGLPECVFTDYSKLLASASLNAWFATHAIAQVPPSSSNLGLRSRSERASVSLIRAVRDAGITGDTAKLKRISEAWCNDYNAALNLLN
jgi:hypothetical protein